MSEHGTTLVGVTLGTVAQAKALQELTGNRGALYVVDDRNREPVSYALMHLTHAKEFKDIVPADADALQDGALAQGFDDKPHFEGDAQQWAGDVLQLGGVFVLGPGGLGWWPAVEGPLPLPGMAACRLRQGRPPHPPSSVCIGVAGFARQHVRLQFSQQAHRPHTAVGGCACSRHWCPSLGGRAPNGHIQVLVELA